VTDTTVVQRHRVQPNGRSTTSVATLVLAALLFVAAVILGFSMLDRMKESAGWVVHTYVVRGEIRTLHLDSAELTAMLAAAAPNDSSVFGNADRELADEKQTLTDLRAQTRDNPAQQERLGQLEPLLASTRSQIIACSADPRCLPSLTPYQQEFLRSMYDRHQRILAILNSMDTEERKLLEDRLAAWSRRFGIMVAALAISFLSAAFLVLFNVRMLLREIDRRERSEQLIREHVDSYRALSSRILELQDTERRKIARELHDSIGQYLAGLKFQVSQIEGLVATSPAASQALLSETSDLLDRCLAEVRTISHLLHPPLLDELGLYSAARWYVEGFAERSGLQADFSVDDFVDRLHKDAEIALFRVLQEALTNVHRHAEAKRVQIDISCKNDQAVLLVKDDGHGIPPETLRRYREGHGGGIGLAGMRERLSELGGDLTVDSSASGTVLRACLPTNACRTPRPEAATVLA
jgi:signal transduction histidine kinase